MPDFNIRSDSVNVEQIMEQIRARIREKRGVDYTEQQLRELASVRLERFPDPQKVRSELLQQFRDGAPPALPNYVFEDTTLYESHRVLLRWTRKLLNPILKLFFNPNKVIQALHIQAELNRRHADPSLTFELLHNLVLETTRLGIEVKNLKMRVESLSGRFDFAERRARALEGVVQYRPGAEVPGTAETAAAGPAAQAGREGDQTGGADGRRRRRRRRGRRGTPGRPAAAGTSAPTPPGGAAGGDADDAGPDEQASVDGHRAADEDAPAPPEPKDQ